ncbi:MAG: hypothetical protein ACLFTT_12420 [Candidatus Hydrogenedentota bacterium]
MLRSYAAIYDHGRIEWLDAPPPLDRTRIVVVAEESPQRECTPGASVQPNGDVLAALVEQWSAEARTNAVGKFGVPTAWQHALRRERHQPGREMD